MHPVRLALLAATLAALALALPAVPAAGQQGAPACSNGVDDDSDNAVDGADAGCAGGSDTDETDSPYAGIVFETIALPLVTLQGTVDDKGNVDVKKLQIRAKRGSVVNVTCKGKSCPVKSARRRMITSTLRLGVFERGVLKAPATLTMRIARPQQLGKLVRYRLRRGKAPVRTDACLDGATQKATPCFGD